MVEESSPGRGRGPGRSPGGALRIAASPWLPAMRSGDPGACPCSAGALRRSCRFRSETCRTRSGDAAGAAADRLDAAPAARRPEADRKEIGHERTMGVEAAGPASYPSGIQGRREQDRVAGYVLGAAGAGAAWRKTRGRTPRRLRGRVERLLGRQLGQLLLFE